MGVSFVKLTSVVLVMVMLGGCMTIAPDNRAETVVELANLGRVSTTISPLVSAIGPVRTIYAQTNSAALMVAGQLGVQLGYEYFVILDSRITQHISGAFYRGTGRVGTTTIHSITVAYTNDENLDGRHFAYTSSSLLDGHTFTTRNGRIASWGLFGATLTLGTIIMLSALSVDHPNWNDPDFDSKMREAERRENRRLIGGGILMGSSLLFTIPLFR